ncbi:hypothetical protein [Thiorhodospira sibirica]|uniref:hypothetical protein n=1 Tax=Thiorhodospira sibirica TaxID=154347 RepID=UPI00022C05A0|nr:hypothetical protein [Thiorhodospira sibirica]
MPTEIVTPEDAAAPPHPQRGLDVDVTANEGLLPMIELSPILRRFAERSPS